MNFQREDQEVSKLKHPSSGHISVLDPQQEVIFMSLKLNTTQGGAGWGSISCEVNQLRKVNEAKASAHGKPGGVRSAPR